MQTRVISPDSTSKATTPLVKGVIISLILIVFSLAIQFMNLTQNKAVGSLQFVILIAGIIWSCTSFAKQMNANVTFGNVFSHGFKTAAAITAIMVVFTIISLKFINPEMKEIALQQARTQLEERNMADDQIDSALSLTTKYFIPFTVGSMVLFFLIIGLIASLVGAAVAKKNPQGPFVQQG
jgi:NADH:ubiquinone oxidoreductase subunit 6 (subunit J)